MTRSPSASLSVSARDGDEQAVRRLLQEDAAAHEPYLQQALRDASERGHLAVVETLLSAGVHADAAGDDARTALHVAARRGHEAVALSPSWSC
ncbi:hypothetical protein ATCC90586_005847 [Pythium insidiosum]|nr:hypothetical protein ATCC90586_005847 [Pythium insidiosum]